METTATALEIERLERKVDMTLDEIIKMQKKSQRKAKRATKKPFKDTQKKGSQGFLASHSAIRQGKLAQFRPSHANSFFLITKRAGFRALNSNDMFKMKRRSRRRICNITLATGAATRNIRVLVSNQFSRRLSPGRRKGGVTARLNCARNKLPVDDPESNGQTLDSRFASLRGGQQVQLPCSQDF